MLCNILLNILRSEETVFEIGMYDGDVCEDVCMEVCENVCLIIINLDMLYVSMLLLYKVWVCVLFGLRYVVVDEVYVYSGVFGLYVVFIIRCL